MTINVVAYYRYSTDKKAQVDNSELRQQATVEKIIYRHHPEWKLIKSVVDKAVSGRKAKPELIRLKEDIESGDIKVDIICVDNMDRLSRRPVLDWHLDIGWIRDNNIMISCNDIKNGEPLTVKELAEDLTQIVKQTQKAGYLVDISEKSSGGVRRLAESQELGWLGRAPYGYDFINKDNANIKSTLVPNKDLKVITKIFKHFLRKNSVRSCIVFLDELSEYKNNPAKHGTGTTVKNILRSAIYCGIRTVGVRAVGEDHYLRNEKINYVAQSPLKQAQYVYDYKGEGFKPAVTIDQYKKVQEILDNNQKSFKKYPERCKHFYSGLLKCSHCNTPLTAATWKRGENRNEGLVRYVCPKSTDNTKQCKAGDKPHRKGIRTDEIEPLIEKHFGILLMDYGFHWRHLKILSDKMIRQSSSLSRQIKEDYDLQKDRFDRMMEEMTSGDIETFKLAKPMLDKKAAELKELEDRVTDSLLVDDEIDFAKQQFEEMNDNVSFFAYFGWVYKSAVVVAKAKEEDRNAVLEEESERLMYITRSIINHYSKSENKGWRQRMAPEATTESLANIADSYGEKITGTDILNILINMGLGHILVSFELGVWRGKPRQIPTEIAMVFPSMVEMKPTNSVTRQKRTGTGVVMWCNRIEVLHS